MIAGCSAVAPSARASASSASRLSPVGSDGRRRSGAGADLRHGRARFPEGGPRAASAATSGDSALVNKKLAYATGDYIVYPSHGVGRITGIESQTIAGIALEM